MIQPIIPTITFGLVCFTVGGAFMLLGTALARGAR